MFRHTKRAFTRVNTPEHANALLKALPKMQPYWLFTREHDLFA